MLTGFEVGDDFADGSKGIQPGVYEFKVAESIVKEDDKDNRQILEIAITLHDDSKEVGALRFITFDVNHPSDKKKTLEKGKFSSFCKVIGIEKVNSEKDFIGKEGKVLIGKEQKYSDPYSIYAKIYNGGIGCWFSKDNKSATEIASGKSSDHFTEAFKKCIDKPILVKFPRNMLISESQFNALDWSKLGNSTETSAPYTDAF